MSQRQWQHLTAHLVHALRSKEGTEAMKAAAAAAVAAAPAIAPVAAPLAGLLAVGAGGYAVYRFFKD
jgi:hypothetical protein